MLTVSNGTRCRHTGEVHSLQEAERDIKQTLATLDR